MTAPLIAQNNKIEDETQNIMNLQNSITKSIDEDNIYSLELKLCMLLMYPSQLYTLYSLCRYADKTDKKNCACYLKELIFITTNTNNTMLNKR